MSLRIDPVKPGGFLMTGPRGKTKGEETVMNKNLFVVILVVVAMLLGVSIVLCDEQEDDWKTCDKRGCYTDRISKETSERQLEKYRSEGPRSLEKVRVEERTLETARKGEEACQKRCQIRLAEERRRSTGVHPSEQTLRQEDETICGEALRRHDEDVQS